MINKLGYIFRSWRSSKNSLFINLTGLTTGLTCTLFIYLWVIDEFSFDKFHEKDSQLYQVMTKVPTNAGMLPFLKMWLKSCSIRQTIF